MQKLVILDSETGICHIVNCPIGFDADEEEYESYISDIEKMLEIHNFHSCAYMVALEINDTTK